MTTSYKALCSDHYVNQRLNLKMDLPLRRDTALSLLDRIRRDFPWMNVFKRYQNELALESAAGHERQQWVALRKTSIRSGSVNPDTAEDALALHKVVLEVAPYYLDISPLDAEYVELLYGFDLLAPGNHDSIVFDALIAGSPLAPLAEGPGERVLECQPMLGLSLTEHGDVQAHYEVKTRKAGAETAMLLERSEEPISVYLTVRKYGPMSDIADYASAVSILAEHAEDLISTRVMPHLLMPLRDAIAAGS